MISKERRGSEAQGQKALSQSGSRNQVRLRWMGFSIGEKLKLDERKWKIAEKSAGNSGKDPGNGKKNDAHIHPEKLLADVFEIDA